MYQSDLKHTNPTLKNKLHALYNLNRGRRLELSFRTGYLELLEKFGNPHLNLPPVIHVAGTNGKGSIIAIMRSILKESGKHVHTYTSPHLYEFNERIVLAGHNINNIMLESLIDEALELNNDADITFFEITTAMAFAAFSRIPADILLLEVGLGGRLDCTNIIPTAAASIISTISRDHTEFLGETLKEIAFEKSGIMKPEVPCVIAPQTIDMTIFKDLAESRNTPIYTYGADWNIEPYPQGFDLYFRNGVDSCPNPSLTGTHQIYNAGAAIVALKLIGEVSAPNLNAGLKNAHWPGRLQNVTNNFQAAQNCEIWFDGGHNQAAGEILASQIEEWNKFDRKDVHLIIGMMNHKNPAEFITPLLPHVNSITAIPIPGEPNSFSAEELQNILQSTKPMKSGAVLEIHTGTNIKKAVENIQTSKHQSSNIQILITGSLYLADHTLPTCHTNAHNES